MEGARFEGGRLLDGRGDPSPWPELAVLGDPVVHSLSPRLHNAALAARGIQARYAAIRVAATDLPAALAAARAARVRGLNITVPHKELALESVERRTEEVERIGAANTLVLRQGEWTAHNTDARGLAMALERDLGSALGGRLSRCLVLGAGGAARAAVAALEGLGARAIEVAARDPDRARWAERFGARAIPFARIDPGRPTLVVNCTPLGLHEEDPSPVDAALLDPGAYVLDLTYGTHRPALLAAFVGRGQDGRAMLVAQAALAFSVWYGALPPLVEMAAAIGLDW